MTKSTMELRPVALFIHRQDEEDKMHLCEVAIYAGFLSHEHVYAKLVKKNCDNWPQYIKMGRKLCKPSEFKFTKFDGRRTAVREHISEDGNPPKISQKPKTFFDEFTGDKNCTIADICEIVRTGFFKTMYISDESLIKEP